DHIYFLGAVLTIGEAKGNTQDGEQKGPRTIGIDFGVAPKMLLNVLTMLPGLQAGKLLIIVLEAFDDPEAAIEAAIYSPELLYNAITGGDREVNWDEVKARDMVVAFMMNDKTVKQLSK